MCGSNGIVPAPTQLLVCAGTNSVMQQGVSWGTSGPQAGTAPCPAACDYPALLVAADNATCWCATPITVKIRLKSPSFTYFDSQYLTFFQGLAARALNLSLYQVRASNTTRVPGLYAQDVTLLLFPPPPNVSFDELTFANLFLQFASWSVSAGEEWSLSVAGPYDFLDFLTGMYDALTITSTPILSSLLFLLNQVLLYRC